MFRSKSMSEWFAVARRWAHSITKHIGIANPLGSMAQSSRADGVRAIIASGAFFATSVKSFKASCCGCSGTSSPRVPACNVVASLPAPRPPPPRLPRAQRPVRCLPSHRQIFQVASWDGNLVHRDLLKEPVDFGVDYSLEPNDPNNMKAEALLVAAIETRTCNEGPLEVISRELRNRFCTLPDCDFDSALLTGDPDFKSPDIMTPVPAADRVDWADGRKICRCGAPPVSNKLDPAHQPHTSAFRKRIVCVQCVVSQPQGGDEGPSIFQDVWDPCRQPGGDGWPHVTEFCHFERSDGEGPDKFPWNECV